MNRPADLSTTRETILSSLSSEEVALRRLGVEQLSLFGSCSRNEASPQSDVDLIVQLERVTFDGYMDVLEHVERTLDRPVDLLLAGSIKPALRATIEKEMVHVPGF
jgi:predicted nucleotidyltransferase